MTTERTITLAALVWLFVQWLIALRELRYRDSLIIDMRLKQNVVDQAQAPDEPENDLMLTASEIQRANDVIGMWRQRE
jgi:hypothetical protein